MTRARTFDELTSWHHVPTVGFGLGWDPGWRPGGGAFDANISSADPYWGRVLDKAKTAYGDPNMHFDTADPQQDRHLVFGDGTRVPAGGQLAYHDSAGKQTYLLNDDGSVSPLGANGQGGQPIFPAGFRKTADGKVAPVDAGGHQLAPLAALPPPNPNGYHDQNSILTPRNARGDYYVDDPSRGERQYFDAAGKPISEQQFRDGAADPSKPPGPAPLATDEQQSGHAADAVRKLHQELKDRYGAISKAEGDLSEALLTAHAATTDGQQKLNAIQQKIVAAVNNPAVRPDTPAGEQAYLKFLRGQVAAIGDVLKSGGLVADDQSKTIAALTSLYAIDPPGNPTAPDASPGADPPPLPPVPTPAPAPAAPAPVDTAPGGGDALPDPTLSDLGLTGMGAPLGGADPMSALASSLPAGLSALSPLTGLGAEPLSSLAGLGGLAGPLAGLASQFGDPARNNPDEAPDDYHRDTARDEHGTDPEPAKPADPAGGDDHHGTASPPDPEPAPGGGAPPAAPGAPPAPTNTVSLPDGSTVTAHTPALAAAVTANLTGQPVDAAYHQAGLDLPPPGTPITKPVDPARLSAGMIGMFKDHYVVALSTVKALQNGAVVPLSSVGSGPDFLGWMDPAAAAPSPAPVPATVPTG